jgi:hypothetical protein
MAENEELLEMVPEGFDTNVALTAFGKLMDYAREATITEREKAKYSTIRDIMITEITHKYQFYHDLLVATFTERNKVIEEHFKIIDAGLKQNDNTKIHMGLKSLTDFVKESPFRNIQNITNIQERHNLLESGELSVL